MQHRANTGLVFDCIHPEYPVRGQPQHPGLRPQVADVNVDAWTSGQFAGNLWPRCDIAYCMRWTILASEVCSDDLCDYAATSFVLDPSGDAGPTGPYCDRCGRKIVKEYCRVVSPGWTFRPGRIHGDLSSRPPAAPLPPRPLPREKAAAQDDDSFVSYVYERLTS